MAIEMTALASGLFEGILKKLAVNVLFEAGRKSLVALRSIDTDFDEHLRISYDRCTLVKTILNRDEPVNLLSLYVNLKFKAAQSKAIDDFELIEIIDDKKRAVIIGGGGGGKTIFMKYL